MFAKILNFITAGVIAREKERAAAAVDIRDPRRGHRSG
jgi:hypothetical protein